MKDHVTSAEIALDAYEGAVLPPGGLSFRGRPVITEALIRALLADLSVYITHHGLDFDWISLLTASQSRRSDREIRQERPDGGWRVNDAVEADPEHARPTVPKTRGYVSSVHLSSEGEAEYTVVFPGVPARQFRMASAELRTAEPFPEVETSRGTVTNAADAERAFIKVAARVLRSTGSNEVPSSADLVDHALLAVELGNWAGVPSRRIQPVLIPQIHRAMQGAAASSEAPARLAGRDFPRDLADGIPETPSAGRSPDSRPQPSPRHPRPDH
ncbi:hypothetical protein GCM10009678_66390 [Actinomadura kijaniata]|uniref:Uncharacterized protein n=1 Tax=Actinomadura namibiensis TaxID=182080 RepID=A0A7W3LYD1_ACTNM|nr:hypothetical protein [Actinomadura namibiensis]MBA8956541.1 hypothetical protein [Actinomadura namibiensis]